jgi:hypothetical protein
MNPQTTTYVRHRTNERDSVEYPADNILCRNLQVCDAQIAPYSLSGVNPPQTRAENIRHGIGVSGLYTHVESQDYSIVRNGDFVSSYWAGALLLPQGRSTYLHVVSRGNTRVRNGATFGNSTDNF